MKSWADVFEGGCNGAWGVGEGCGGVGRGRSPPGGECGTVSEGSGSRFWGSDGPVGLIGDSTITDLRSGG